MRLPARLLFAALAVLLSACAPLAVQDSAQRVWPVNSISDGEDAYLMLRGEDAVSYFIDPSPAIGQAAIKSVYKGLTFRFATAEHKAMFEREPERYVPQFGGFCTNGIVYSIPLASPTNSWQIIDGKLYMFGGVGALDAFNLDPVRNLALAERYWREEIEGSNAALQSAKRLVFRVPHYKTGAELQAEVAAAKQK
jgi:YHS domain-containing protein